MAALYAAVPSIYLLKLHDILGIRIENDGILWNIMQLDRYKSMAVAQGVKTVSEVNYILNIVQMMFYHGILWFCFGSAVEWLNLKHSDVCCFKMV